MYILFGISASSTSQFLHKYLQFLFCSIKHCFTSCVVTKQLGRQTNAVEGTLQETLQGSLVVSSVIDLDTPNLPEVAEHQC